MGRIADKLFGKYTLEDIAQMHPEKLRKELDNLEEEAIKEALCGPVPCAYIAVFAGDGPAEVTEFNVVLRGFSHPGTENYLSLVKCVRNLLAIGLGQAKGLVDASRSNTKGIKLKEGVCKQDAEYMKKALEEAGGLVTVEDAY